MYTYLTLDDYKHDIYRVHRIININGAQNDCSPENNQAKEYCINELIMSKLKCQLPWMNQTWATNKRRMCNMTKDLDNYFDVINSIHTEEFEKDVAKFGCLIPNCQTVTWSIISRDNYVTFSKGQNISKILIQFLKTDCMKTTRHILMYGFSNFVADFGGYLGLLLGASLLSIYDNWIEFMLMLWAKIK